MTKPELIEYYLKYFSEPRNPHMLHYPYTEAGQDLKQYLALINEMVEFGYLKDLGNEVYSPTKTGYEILEAGGLENYRLAKTVLPKTTPNPNIQSVKDEKISNSDRLNIFLFILGVIVTILLAVFSDKIKL